ncbi:MAG TPA: shikimate dehydrogenase [Chthoniobacterales bacterium]|jgi:shikimate dehydrogenase
MAKTFYTLEDLRAWLDARAPAPESIALGVVGDPVAHSRSPEMQNAALIASEIPLLYARFQILPNDLAEALRAFRDLGFRGVNLTAPHKIAGLSLVDDADDFAREAGAINTIRFEKKRSRATNTDGPGFVRAIRESFGADLRDLRVLILGAGGGAGRAIAAQCARDGCKSLILANRDLAKMQAFAARLKIGALEVIPWENDSLGAASARSDLIVQATPQGSQPNEFARHHLVYDLNYQPTALQQSAARHASGLTMLLHQGGLAFEFWFDRSAPLEAMRRALGLAPQDSR